MYNEMLAIITNRCFAPILVDCDSRFVNLISLIIDPSDLCILIMPPRIICVDATVDGKKVGGEYGVFQTIDDTDERTCHQPLLAFLRDKWLGDLP